MEFLKSLHTDDQYDILGKDIEYEFSNAKVESIKTTYRDGKTFIVFDEGSHHELEKRAEELENRVLAHIPKIIKTCMENAEKDIENRIQAYVKSEFRRMNKHITAWLKE